MNITIDKTLKSITPKFNVGIVSCNVQVTEDTRITTLIEEYEEAINRDVNITDVVNMNIIKQARDAYKLYGKDPSRYRLAVESLYRRLSKGNKLYRINNVVDLGNILSLYTKRSVAVLDQDKISGNILIRLGKETDEYFGIGRGRLNIENVPLYEDDLGAFGSTTSDTERTMITNDTKRILVFIISFSGRENLEKEIDYAISLYKEYANGSDFVKKII